MNRIKAVLTGHSRGLGAAVAGQLLARDIAVMGLSRHRNDDLAGRFPDRLTEVELDLSACDALTGWLMTGAMNAYLADAATVLLINNAGLVQPVGAPGTQDAGMIARAVGVNLLAPLLLTNAFVAVSAHAADRRILHVSSGAGRGAYPGWSVYCATKAALDAHAQAVALDQLPALRIGSLAPGVIDTDMQGEIRASLPEQFPLRNRFIALKQQHQLATPAETARALLDYLLGERFGEVAIADLCEH